MVCQCGSSVDGSKRQITPCGLTDGQAHPLGECKPVSCGEPFCVMTALVGNREYVHVEGAAYKWQHGYTTTGLALGSTTFTSACTGSGLFCTAPLLEEQCPEEVALLSTMSPRDLMSGAHCAAARCRAVRLECDCTRLSRACLGRFKVLAPLCFLTGSVAAPASVEQGTSAVVAGPFGRRRRVQHQHFWDATQKFVQHVHFVLCWLRARRQASPGRTLRRSVVRRTTPSSSVEGSGLQWTLRRQPRHPKVSRSSRRRQSFADSYFLRRAVEQVYAAESSTGDGTTEQSDNRRFIIGSCAFGVRHAPKGLTISSDFDFGVMLLGGSN